MVLQQTSVFWSNSRPPVRKYKAMKQTVIYSRVSTDRQSHDSQLTELRHYCANRGWTDVEEIIDTISGARNSRQGLDRLMSMVRHGKVSVVVCFKLDRLGRSLSHLVQLVDEFATHRVALVVPSQGIDTSAKNPMAEMQLGMMAVFAQFERAIIVERVNAGLAAAKKRGVRLGRPRKVNEHHEAVASLRAQGLSGRAIAKELGTSNSNVFRLIATLEKPCLPGELAA
jgi:DNA invertase Pin-like site-specific DNA recombinase